MPNEHRILTAAVLHICIVTSRYKPSFRWLGGNKTDVLTWAAGFHCTTCVHGFVYDCLPDWLLLIQFSLNLNFQKSLIFSPSDQLLYLLHLFYFPKEVILNSCSFHCSWHVFHRRGLKDRVHGCEWAKCCAASVMHFLAQTYTQVGSFLIIFHKDFLNCLRKLKRIITIRILETLSAHLFPPCTILSSNITLQTLLHLHCFIGYLVILYCSQN